MKNIKIIEMKGFWQNFMGLMGKKNINYAIKLKCNGIHTFFMKQAIDVVLCDKNNIVIDVIYNLKPWKIVLPKKNWYFTYEFPVGIINFKRGDKLEY